MWGIHLPSKKKEITNKVTEVKYCSNCKFKHGYTCVVGTYLAEQGKTGMCYQGELWTPLTT